MKLLEIVAQQIQVAINNAKQAEALRESEERYRDLIETARDVIFTLSLNGTITSLNRAFETTTGFSRSEWLEKSFIHIIHPDDLSFANNLFQRGLKGEVVPIFELRVLSKPGEYLVGEFMAAHQIQSGKMSGFLGIVRDITERRRAEERIAEQAALLDITTDAIVIKDMEHRVLFWNKGAERLYNWKAEEVTGNKIIEFLYTAETLLKTLYEVLKVNQKIFF